MRGYSVSFVSNVESQQPNLLELGNESVLAGRRRGTGTAARVSRGMSDIGGLVQAGSLSLLLQVGEEFGHVEEE